MTIANQFGDNDSQVIQPLDEFGDLATWVMPKIDRAREVRDENYATRWDEYTRLWRGFWDAKDKKFKVERSKIISPALSQAVEMTVAEIEEATFGREQWFEIADDIADEQKEDAIRYRDQLREDMHLCDVPAACAEVFLLGAVYGTGIGKINVELAEENTAYGGPREKVKVTLTAVRPDEFLIDPGATKMRDAMFCAHEMIVPLHIVRQRQIDGVYREDVFVGRWTGADRPDTDGTGALVTTTSEDDVCRIVEYFGLVPGSMIGEEPGMVEAVVTIANDGVVLRATKNFFEYNDRPFIVYQHDTVPGEFWGRGVCEKG